MNELVELGQHVSALHGGICESFAGRVYVEITGDVQRRDAWCLTCHRRVTVDGTEA